MLPLLLCVPCAQVSAPPTGSPAQPGLGDYRISASGALLAGPRDLRTVDGPEIVLANGWAEWFAVSFSDRAGAHEFVGEGARVDWAGRAVFTAQERSHGPGWVRVVATGGPLRVETRFELEGELLVAHVDLWNVGHEELAQVFYAREWLRPGEASWSFPPDIDDGRALPSGLARRLWMFDDLAPGANTGATFSYRVGAPVAALGNVEVPLVLYVDALWPNGVTLGATNGVSFGDYDADGWIDIFSCMSARLMHNEAGTTYRLGNDLDVVLPRTSNRYGSSFGDYDNDGLPDIGTEPRAVFGQDDSCMHMLHNLGAAQFEDIAIDPLLFEGQPCHASAETICWGDVDDDGDLDCFLPVYGANLGPGNFFMENLGPTGPGGAYRFRETSAEAGLDNPPMTARPEGAQFLDVDGDGDMDCYSNGTLYQNQSEGRPHFVAMTAAGSGIGLRGALDEGAAFFDYDLDGDQDLFIVYTQRGVRVWESRGDGTFFEAVGIIDSPNTGLDLGLSAEDWDHDGDVDFTTRQVFRRNRFVEDGARHFTVARHSIPANHLTSATPAWGDWDKDGDLDCALGNWQSTGHFYVNTAWDGLAADQKPYLRVRVVRDDPAVPRGLETEYGAHVNVHLHGDTFEREKFVASGHGYLNQNEYALSFFLPSGPNPAVPVEGLVCDIAVDFPGRASRGVLRVDRFVNPALGGIAIADLADREITVFRSGRVVIDGVEHAPDDRFHPRVFGTGGGPAIPDPVTGLAEPKPANGDANWVGIEVVAPLRRAVLVKELVLDGVLAPPREGVPYNLVLWDVTDALHPVRVLELAATTRERNRRAVFPFVVELAPGHRYRAAADVLEKRASPPTGILVRPGLTLAGGLDFVDEAPLTGKKMLEASLEPRSALVLRYVTERKPREQ